MVINTSTGYITFGGHNVYTPYYTITDYLGNVRTVLSQSGQVVFAQDYYPYGLAIAGIHSDLNEYTSNTLIAGLNKYTSKELQTADFASSLGTGLEMYDFHARFYDPQLGRWFTPDPAEQFHNPYLAMGNNPVVYVDPDGEFVFPFSYFIHRLYASGVDNKVN